MTIITSLPKDCLNLIFFNLDLSSLTAANGVCALWRKTIANELEARWRMEYDQIKECVAYVRDHLNKFSFPKEVKECQNFLEEKKSVLKLTALCDLKKTIRQVENKVIDILNCFTIHAWHPESPFGAEDFFIYGDILIQDSFMPFRNIAQEFLGCYAAYQKYLHDDKRSKAYQQLAVSLLERGKIDAAYLLAQAIPCEGYDISKPCSALRKSKTLKQIAERYVLERRWDKAFEVARQIDHAYVRNCAYLFMACSLIDQKKNHLALKAAQKMGDSFEKKAIILTRLKNQESPKICSII